MGRDRKRQPRAALVDRAQRTRTDNGTRTLDIPSFQSSDDPEDFTVHALLHEHVCKLLDQRTQPMLGPVGNMLIKRPGSRGRLPTRGSQLR